MKCPKCQSENLEINKFYPQHVSKLSFACSQCSAEVLPSDKFCGQCGKDLVIFSKISQTDHSFDEKPDRIQRYLPKGLTEKILSPRNKIEGERRQVTVMFCDLEGFTPLVKQLGVEKAYGVMDQVYELLLSLGGSHIAEAEQRIRKAVAADDKNEMRFHLGLDHALYAEFFKRQGNWSKVQEQFGRAFDILR